MDNSSTLNKSIEGTHNIDAQLEEKDKSTFKTFQENPQPPSQLQRKTDQPKEGITAEEIAWIFRHDLERERQYQKMIWKLQDQNSENQGEGPAYFPMDRRMSQNERGTNVCATPLITHKSNKIFQENSSEVKQDYGMPYSKLFNKYPTKVRQLEYENNWILSGGGSNGVMMQTLYNWKIHSGKELPEID